ncbi:hypothetical protein ACOSQ3_006500 [Xanthoceras sorbifolium]
MPLVSYLMQKIAMPLKSHSLPLLDYIRDFSCKTKVNYYHDISAAVGKVGAMVGAFGFSAAMHAVGLRKVFIVFSVVNFLGMMFTFLVPESQGKSLEEIFGDADVETADAENGTST